MEEQIGGPGVGGRVAVDRETRKGLLQKPTQERDSQGGRGRLMPGV